MVRWKTILLLGALALAACGRKAAEEQAPAPAAEQAPPSVEAPAMDATGAPAAEDAVTAAPAALDETSIVEDPQGAWATSAQASSTYRGSTPKDPYSAWQATGAPDVPRYSDNAQSWASQSSDRGPEWLEVMYETPVHANAVRVRQTHAPGAIVKVELIDVAGGRHVVWEGVDQTRGTRDRIVWFTSQFERTPYRVRGVKLSLASEQVWGWNEIDAVQLVNADPIDDAPGGSAQAVADGAAVRVESAYLAAGWLEGRIGPSPSGCRMVFLDKPAEGGYTSVALMTLKRLERKDGAQWREVAVQPLLDREPAHCLEAAAD